MFRTGLFLLLGLLLSGCAKTGYNPSYIISDTASAVEEPIKAQPE
jgi:hypothetical protein